MIISGDEFTGNIGNKITGLLFGEKFLKGHLNKVPVYGSGFGLDEGYQEILF